MSPTRGEHYYTAAISKPRRAVSAEDSQANIFFQGQQGGRAMLPPINSAFPTSQFPDSTTYTHHQLAEPRSSPARYDFNTQALLNTWTPNSPPAQNASSFADYNTQERYTTPTQSAYTAYPTRSSPPFTAESPDSRKLPPLPTASNATTAERWPTSTAYVTTSPSYNAAPMRSPPTTYAATYNNYPAANPTASYTYQTSVNTSPQTVLQPTLAVSYDDLNRGIYNRSTQKPVPPPTFNPPPPPPPTFNPPPPPPISPTSTGEHAIKKKRKRADPSQVKILNETFNRTQFPSTAERAMLADKLEMSARSVQIWFQNKRQQRKTAERQSGNTSPTSNQVHNAPNIPATSTQIDAANLATRRYDSNMPAMFSPRGLPDNVSRPDSSNSPQRRLAGDRDATESMKWGGY